MLDEIVALVATEPIEEPLTYLVPGNLAGQIQIGHCVKVPLGRRHTTGYVVNLDKLSQLGQIKYKLKAITSLVREYRFFNPEQLPWFNWIAKYYGNSLASILETAVPAVVSELKEEIIISALKPEVPPRGPKAKAILEYILSKALPLHLSEVRKQFPGSTQSIKKLKSSGLLQTKLQLAEMLPRETARLLPEQSEEITLTEHQLKAFRQISESIDKSVFNPFLLHGITGSGKTEVYLQAAERVLSQGKGVLILVPEISLTPQLIGRVEERLKHSIAILHSAVHQRDRWESWKNLILGKAQVCLGARSAVFAPIHNLGLIIVDEEHDGSYKQSEGIRYHGRDIAVMRAKLQACPIILGSATPSLESWSNAISKRYHFLALPKRPLQRSKAEIEIVDLNKIPYKKMSAKTISPRLHELLLQNLEKGEQSFLLYNRRGFATYLQCQLCQEPAYCPNCSVTFTLHSSRDSLVCHYCGMVQIAPQYCTKCNPQQILNKDWKPAEIPMLVRRGAGTERAVEDIKALFPQARVERLDRDSVSSTADLITILNKVRKAECDILIGTQMIAKGHDMPNVTLVGVLDSDIGMHMPDFRASERVFHLLTQVAGRAGRGDLDGKVILQTHLPQHQVLLAALNDDFAGFASFELQRRKELSYPPFGKLLRIVVSHSDAQITRTVTEHLAMLVLKHDQDSGKIICLGPSACPFERLRGLFRYHLLLKSQSASELSSCLKQLKETSKKILTGKYKKTRITFDLDPQDML